MFDLKEQTRRNPLWARSPVMASGVVIVFAILNGIAWLLGSPLLHGLNVFSAGFVLGMLGTSIAVYLYGYRKVV